MGTLGLLSLVVASLVLGPGLTGLAPRVSFPLGSPGRRLAAFSSRDVSNGTTLLLSEDAERLYVGARDGVLALDVSRQNSLVLRSKLDWRPSEADLEQCAMKGKKTADCANFIRVLQLLNQTHLYACGTFAFSPRCVYVNRETLKAAGRPEEGRGRCPYDPYQHSSAIIVDGELYTGTVADYRGNRPVISRHLSGGDRVDLKLDDTLGWLEDPTFISSSFVPEDQKVLFFFTEVGREYSFIDRFLVSRVAQVCTSDVGGQRTLQRRWTTFAKAQLLCRSDGELPYNVLQDMDVLPPAEGAAADDTLFYGVFSSQWSVNSGRSAVCSFRLSDVRSAFSGNYKVLNRDTLQWSSRVQEKVANPGECGLHNASDNALRFVKENFLAEDSIRPAGRRPTAVSTQHAYSHLRVLRVRAASGRFYTVLFLLTEAGRLHKAVLLPTGAHVVEEVQVFEPPQPVSSLALSRTKGVVYVGTAGAVLAVPAANCSFYWTCAQCVLARDPFCGWDPVRRACVEVSGAQNPLNQDVDGGNVERTCSSASLTQRFSLSKLPTASCPAGELVHVSLDQVVRLRCPAASRLSRQQWQRPNSRLPPDLYLTLDDGGLSFVATPATLGHYLCLSTENGYRQTTAVYHVKQGGGPAAQPPANQTRAPTRAGPGPHTPPGVGTLTPGPSARNPPVPTRWFTTNRTSWMESGPSGSGLRSPCPSYLEELVLVSVLLALCVSLLLTVTLYAVRLRCRRRTAPQAETPARDRSTSEEQAALRGNRVPRSGGAGGPVCNGTLAGSREVLPNIPI